MNTRNEIGNVQMHTYRKLCAMNRRIIFGAMAVTAATALVVARWGGSGQANISLGLDRPGPGVVRGVLVYVAVWPAMVGATMLSAGAGLTSECVQIAVAVQIRETGLGKASHVDQAKGIIRNGGKRRTDVRERNAGPALDGFPSLIAGHQGKNPLMNGDQATVHHNSGIHVRASTHVDRDDPSGTHLRGSLERKHVQSSPVDEYTLPHLDRGKENRKGSRRMNRIDKARVLITPMTEPDHLTRR